MSKRKSSEDDELNQALAILLSNTRSNKRPSPLTEVAYWLNIAVKKLGSVSAVADRLGLSTKMLRQFSYVGRLAPKVQHLVASRKLDSVDAVTHLAMLPANKQEAVATALEKRSISTSDVRSIVQLQRAGYSSSIPTIINRVKKEKTKREYIAEFVIRGSRDRKRIINAFQKYISPENILRLELAGAIGRLVLTNDGRKELSKAARQLRTPLSKVIPKILED